MEKAVIATRNRLVDKIDSNTRVLEYKYEQAQREAVPYVAVNFCRDIIQARKELPTLSDDDIIKNLVSRGNDLKTFIADHPTMTKMMLASDAPRRLVFIEKLARLRNTVNDEFTHDHANVVASSMILEHCASDIKTDSS